MHLKLCLTCNRSICYCYPVSPSPHCFFTKCCLTPVKAIPLVLVSYLFSCWKTTLHSNSLRTSKFPGTSRATSNHLRRPNYRVIISLGKQTIQPFKMVFPGVGLSTGSPAGKSSAKTLILRERLVNR